MGTESYDWSCFHIVNLLEIKCLFQLEKLSSTLDEPMTKSVYLLDKNSICNKLQTINLMCLNIEINLKLTLAIR